MREFVCTFVGVIGSVLSFLFGGWDASVIALCIFMAIDMVSGVAVALIFHNSPKNKNGKLESKPFLKGVVKKISTLLLVAVANILDTILATDFVRTAVVIAFITNETISIIENAGLMGIPIPAVLANAIELLSRKDDENE